MLLTFEELTAAWDHPWNCDCDLCLRAWVDMTDPNDKESMDEIPKHIRSRVEAIRLEEEKEAIDAPD